jgi:hypothetical protein
VEEREHADAALGLVAEDALEAAQPVGAVREHDALRPAGAAAGEEQHVRVALAQGGLDDVVVARVREAELRAAVAAGVVAGAPTPVRRSITDRTPLGHELMMQIAIEIGKAVAIGVVSGVAKDLIVSWVKEQVKKRGLTLESKDNTG